MSTTSVLLVEARKAKLQIANATTEQKNTALALCAKYLIEDMDQILKANEQDLADAKGHISEVMLDRLTLTEERIRGMAKGIEDVITLPDPVGKILEESIRPNGLRIQKVSVPFGVVAMIFESRPNVTSDGAALAIKSGNVCVLRGGKEAIHSNTVIVSTLRKAVKEAGFSENTVNLVTDTSRDSAVELMTAVGFVDLLIPRGGAKLIQAVVDQAKVPCIQTGTGICHIFVDDSADPDMALKIIENAKTSRPSVCNAEEVCLVHEKIAETFLPLLKERLVDKRKQEGKIPVELRLDECSRKIIPGIKASDTDFDTEFLDYVLAVKIVKDAEEAIEHIGIHSTGHSEAIITETDENADLFVRSVDSSCVYVNASTRFTDGGEFGLGCEIGISTQKMHARGPMGLREMNTYKYIIQGKGNIR